MELISSRTNPKIKAVRALRQRKARQENGQFLIEGIRHVGEAVAAEAEHGPAVEAIYFAPDLLNSNFARQLVAEQAGRGRAVYAVTPEVFASLAEKEHPQGILAVARPRPRSLGDLTPQNFPWGVALVAPQDPGNLGTIIRTIDAAGASGALLLDGTLDPYHPSAVRASMGTLFWYPVVQATFEEFAAWAARHAYRIYGTSAHGSRDYREIEHYDRPCILLMGSEREGLTPAQTAACHQVVRLPMLGHATSLNLGVATGVMLYHMLARGGSIRKDPD